MQTIGLVRVTVLVHGRAESPEKGEKKSQPVFSQRPVRGLSDVHCTAQKPRVSPWQAIPDILCADLTKPPVSCVRVRQGQLRRLRWGLRGGRGWPSAQMPADRCWERLPNSSRAHSWGERTTNTTPLCAPPSDSACSRHTLSTTVNAVRFLRTLQMAQQGSVCVC